MNFLDRVDAVAKRIERFVSGGAPQGPFYVTNRTTGQKLRVGLLIGVPLLAIAVFIGLAMNNYFDPPASAEQPTVAKQPTGDVTAKVLPHIEKELAVSSGYSRDVEVLEAAVSRGADHSLAGKLRNTTDHVIQVADLVFDVTDEDGSQLGGISVRVENIPAHAVVPFKTALAQHDARTALVREVHSR